MEDIEIWAPRGSWRFDTLCLEYLRAYPRRFLLFLADRSDLAIARPVLLP